jgi:hypothetical protein
MNLIFLHLKMFHPVRLLRQHLVLPAVHLNLLAVAVLQTMILHLQTLQLIDEHQSTLIQFIIMVIQIPKPVKINYQSGQFNF